MSNSQETKPLSLHRPQRASESFQEFSETERVRREDSGQDFDPLLYDDAVDLVLRKLQQFEEEGVA